MAQIKAALAFLVTAILGFVAGRLTKPDKTQRIAAPAPEIRVSPSDLVLRRETSRPTSEPKSQYGKVKTFSTVELDHLTPIGKVRLEVLELETPSGPRIEVRADGAEIVGGVHHAGPVVRDAPRWAAGLGGMVGPGGVRPVGILQRRSGKITLGAWADLKGGENWSGVGFFASINF